MKVMTMFTVKEKFKLKAPSFHHGVQVTEIKVLLQATILGFFLGELWYFSQAIGSGFYAYIQFTNQQFAANFICAIVGIIVFTTTLLFAPTVVFMNIIVVYK